MDKLNEKKMYTEQESTWASQIAYCNITTDLISELCENKHISEPTFAEICDYCTEEGRSLWNDGKPNSEHDFLMNAGEYEYGSWKIVAVCDDNKESGLYALAIETGAYTQNGVEDGVILAVRGSETQDGQFLTDWIFTDLNVINSDITEQDKKLNEFIDEELSDLVIEKGYKSFAGAGHSLGGYLCFEAMAHIADTNEYLFDLLIQAVSIDGQNPTEEHYLANKSAYDKVSDKLYHYQYSLVGSIFESVAGHNYYIKGASDWQYDPLELEGALGMIYNSTSPQTQYLIQYIYGNTLKHCLPSLRFTEDGEFDLSANDEHLIPPELVGENGNITITSSAIAQVVMYIINCEIAEIDYNGEKDVIAQFVENITKETDENNSFQIFVGGIIEAVTDELRYILKDGNISSDVDSLIANLKSSSIQWVNVIVSYSLYMLSVTSSATQPAGLNISNESNDINLFFNFLSSLSNYIENDKTGVNTKQLFDDVKVIGVIAIEGAQNTLSELVNYEMIGIGKTIQNEVVECTQKIISIVDDWNSYEKCINAQKVLTNNWQNNIQTIDSIIGDISSTNDVVADSWKEYILSSLKLSDMSVVAATEFSHTGKLSANTSNNISILQKSMSDSSDKFLSGLASLAQDNKQLIMSAGIVIRETLNNLFEYLYSVGELELGNTIVDAATSLGQSANKLDIEGLVDGWILRAKSHNGAIDVIYGVSGNVELKGTKESDIIYGNNDDNRIYGLDGNDTIYGGAGHDYVEAGNGDDTVYGGSGYDILQGNAGSDILYGESGNDQIYGGQGSDYLNGGDGDDYLLGEGSGDTLEGGQGNDYLEGAEGRDSYVFNLGDGADTVFDYEYYRGAADDSIVFGSGITPDMVRMERIGNDLVVQYSSSDSFIVKDAYQIWHTGGEYFVEKMVFSDGTVWNTEVIADKANIHYAGNDSDTIEGLNGTVGYHQSETFHGMGGNDVVYASSGNDKIFGEADNDSLYGEDGNDTLIGGRNNDYLDGGNGQDTFVFNLGDGIDTVYDYEYYRGKANDRILFGEGISPDMVRLERFGNDMKVWYSKNDNFIVKDAYQVWHTQGEYFVENIEYADGTVWNTEEIANRANIHLGGSGDDYLVGYGETVGYHQNESFYAGAGNDVVHAGEGADNIYGDAGNDSLYGENGNDTLTGGTGDDYLEGGSGEDRYIFNLGDGNDTILDYEYYRGKSNDCIVFGEGINIDSILLARKGNNLHISYSENDSVTIKDAYSRWHTEGEYYVERMEFFDGTKADINYNTVSLDITYQPEPKVIEEEVIEQISADEAVEGVNSDIVNSEKSLEEYDVDAIAEEVEKILNDAVVDENLSSNAENNMSIGEIADFEMEKLTNLIIQESALQVENNVSDSLTISDNIDASNNQLWVK